MYAWIGMRVLPIYSTLEALLSFKNMCSCGIYVFAHFPST